VELLVEVVYDTYPLLFSFGNRVKLFFYLCRKVVVEDVGEVLCEKIINYYTYVGGKKLAFLITVFLRLSSCADFSVL
jgi:hypothetical protein